MIPSPADLAPDALWHGPVPFGTCDAAGLARLAEDLAAFDIRSREVWLSLAGAFEGARWTAELGVLHAAMAPFRGLPAARVALRFGEFRRLGPNGLAEIRTLWDLPDLARQCGVPVLPPGHGDAAWTEPATPAASGPAETKATAALMARMRQGLNCLEDGRIETMGTAGYFSDDFHWQGPHGVGSARGRAAFSRHIQGPSVLGCPDRHNPGHRCRLADGTSGATTGWPSYRGTFTGPGFWGLEPTGGEITMTIMDFYRRRGDRFAENWVLIDLLDLHRQCGRDPWAAAGLH